jgi:hypothetical protein
MAPGDFMAQVRSVMRLRHLSYRTEQTYCAIIKQFLFFHHKRHPAEMGAAGGGAHQSDRESACR